MKEKLDNLIKIRNREGYILKVILGVCLFLFLQGTMVTRSYAQTTKVNLNVQNVELESVFMMIQQQVGYKVFYNNELVDAKQKVSIRVTDVSLDSALHTLLTPLDMTYKLVNKTIVVSNLKPVTAKTLPELLEITGFVKDKKGMPIPGVTVIYKSTPTLGRATDEKGFYRILVPSLDGELVFSFIGMKTQTVAIKKRVKIDVTMVEEATEMDEVIVTGYVPKAKNSFTGTAVQVKGDDLRKVNPTNLFAALKVFDPSFAVLDDEGMFGSDPNRVPDKIEIRGQNSMPDISQGNLQTYTSLPIFIMDGFQITVQQVFDLDMNRVQSVTILKDAAAASIYGSRAANGVIVIETKVPEGGKLRFSYTFNGSIQVPDLTSYNLMNASELLEYFEKAQLFNNGNKGDNTSTNIYEDLVGGNPGRQNLYTLLSKEVENGVDSYWLSQPLQTSVQHSHSLMLEGGVRFGEKDRRSMRYQVNLSAAPSNGVMKGSKRDRYGAGLKLLYNDLHVQITSDIQVALVKNTDSPYGSFSTYSNLLPIYRMKDENGKYFPRLSYENIPAYEGLPAPDFTGSTFSAQLNPLYEAKYLNSFSRGETTNLTYNLGLNWEVIEGLRVRSTFSISNVQDKAEVYRSPLSADFFDYTSVTDGEETNDGYNLENIYKRGTYTMTNSSQFDYYGSINVSYTKSFGRHLVQGIVGGELKETNSESDAYKTVGFLDDPLGYPSYAVQFDSYTGPSGSSSISRSAGMFANFNYSWDNRYLIDLTGRIDGSSNFASKQRSAPFWSAGVRWNIYNEKFMKTHGWFENLAVRANIGTVGNQNFQLSQIMTLYNFLKMYDGVMGAEIMSIANPELKWQTTLNRNIGLEFSLLQGLVNLDFNYYSNITKNNLTDIAILPSTGFSTYKANMGKVRNQGYEFSLSITPIKKNGWIVNAFVNGAHNKNKLLNISDALRDYNEVIKENQTAHLNYAGYTQLERIFLFEEGQSLNSIFAVRSMGIDPGTGQEIFVTADGVQTFQWNAADQVVVGNTEPTLKGYFGLNVDYKRWSFGANFQYSFGADRYNKTLYEKIEGGNFAQNADRRALTQRWTKPGDVAKYRGYGNTSQLKPTSRFVQKDDFLSMTSARLSYTLNANDLQSLGISLLKFTLSTNDLFYVSTIKQERGLSYPFARTFYFSLQANF